MKLLAPSKSESSAEGVLVDLNHSDESECEKTNEVKEESEVSILKGELLYSFSSKFCLNKNNELKIEGKIQRFEGLLLKCKENIKNQSDRINELQTENDTLKQHQTQQLQQFETAQVNNS